MNLYNLMAWTNNKLFDGIKLPDQVDNETLVSTIMGLYGEYEPIISDPDYFRYQLDYYFRRRFNDFKAIVDALELEYNPIENFDRFEDVTRENNRSNTIDYTRNIDNDRTIDTTITNTSVIDSSKINEIDGTDDTTNKVSAFDSETLSNDTSSTKTLTTNESENIDSTTTDNGTNKVVDGMTESITDKTTNTNDDTETITSHLHGNIGVTTSQQMLESEIQLRTKYNIYEIIAKMFFQEFMIQCL